MARKRLRFVCASLVIGMVFAAAVQSAVPAPMGWWKLDESSGTIAHDSSGQGKDGTVEGNPTWLPTGGKVGGALEFDGAGDQVTVYDAGDFGVTNMMSVAAWVRVPAEGRNWEYVWGYDAYDTPRLMREGTATTFKFVCGTGSAQANLGSAGWHHVVAVADGTEYRLYVDGSLGGQSAYSDLITHNNWRIGNAYGDDTRRFTGAVDDVRVYNQALTQEEIQLIMEGERPAKNPHPVDKATDVPRDIVLGWKPGEYAATHDVYLGTVADDVGNASSTDPLGVLVSPGQDANSYDPADLLEFGRTYYWRVDEVNDAPDYTVSKGRVWQFTVEPFAYALPSENITATASSSNTAEEGPENTINGSGLDATDLHSTEAADMWFSGSEPLGAWIQYEFDKAYKLHQMWVWNYNGRLESLVGSGLKDVTIEYSVDGTDWLELSGVSELARAPGASGYAHNTVVDFGGVAAKYVKITAHSNWGGIFDQYGLSEVRFLYLPVQAREPNPDSGATDVSIGTIDQPLDVTLAFRAGREAVHHAVYFSTDKQAVTDGTAPMTAVTDTAYGPLSLDLGRTYYWRVDEVNEAESPATWQGEVWDFTTQEYFVVDDFEDYNDYDPDTIFGTWVDGWDIPTNGSTVGHSDPDFANGEHFAETQVVHGGRQSMPFYYDDSVGYSEVTRSFDGGRDWTVRGAGVLSLWFRGDSANAAEPMYVALNDKAVIYNDNPDAAQVDAWTEWTVDLQAFADQGVDLTDVDALTLGFGSKTDPAAGGSGVVYFDDIGLTKAVAPLAPGADPNLMGWWKLDEGAGAVAHDSSGQGKDGTVEGDPTWLPTGGKVGGALEFDGTGDQVTVYDAGDFGVTNMMSVAAWVRVPAEGRNWEYVWGYDTYDTPRLMREGTATTFKFAGSGIVGSGAQADLGSAGWHHVVAVADGTAFSLYVDGSLGGQAPYSGSIETYNNWRIGNAYGDDTRRFTGAIDDLRVYNRALTPEEIQSIMEGRL